jgi:hypothetical protein
MAQDLSIWKTTRTGLTFSMATQVTELNMANSDSGFMYITPDGLTMLFQSDRPVVGDTSQDFDIWSATYNIGTMTWSAPGRIAALATNMYETSPSVSSSAALYSISMSGTHPQIYLSAPVGSSPISVPDVNSPAYDQESPVFTPDMCTLYFVSNRPGGSGLQDVWRATRR